MSEQPEHTPSSLPSTTAHGSDQDIDEKPQKTAASPPSPLPSPPPFVSAETSQRSHLSSPSVNNSPASEYGSLERIPTAQDNAPCAEVTQTPTVSHLGPVYSVFTPNQKRFIVFMASWAGFFSPVSGQIYFPALNSLSRDLHVSNGMINLTLTSYMIFQGLAPAFIGDLADATGRRPAYAVCFIIYFAANLGLALQNSYGALFVLRCVQSSGSSGTIAMASAVVSDIATAAERGRYIGFTFAGSLLGPAIGPVLGGVLSQFLGWRSIFWFLLILSAAFLVIFAIFFPETARSQVGNGSIPPKGWNMSLMSYLALRKSRAEGGDRLSRSSTRADFAPKRKRKIRFPNPLSSLRIIFDKENALLLFYNAFLFAAFYDVTAAIPSQFAEIYHYNDLQIGLCYIPFGFGSMCAALTNGQLLDRNYARFCRKLGIKIRKGRNQDLRNFPIEKARLQLAIPASYMAAGLVCVFGWLIDINGPLAPVLVVLFFSSFCMSVAFNVTNTLLIDFYPQSPATATAANNLARCLLGAGATGVIAPMLDAMGRGWTFTFLTLVLVVTSPMLWSVYFWGMGWRQARLAREHAREESKEKRSGNLEAGNVDTHENEERPPTPAEVDGDVPTATATVTSSGPLVDANEGSDESLNGDASRLGPGLAVLTTTLSHASGM